MMKGVIMPDSSSFIDRLDEVYYQTQPPVNVLATSNPAYNGLYQEWQTRTQEPDGAGGVQPVPASPVQTEANFQAQINQLMARWDTSNPDVSERLLFPRSWDDFVKLIRSFFGIGSGTTDPRTGQAVDGFKNAYFSALKTNAASGLDWSALALTDPANEEFFKSFDGFLNSYPFNSSPDPSDTAHLVFEKEDISTFLDKWSKFMTVTAVNQNATTANAGYENLTTYERVFKAFFPGATTADFNEALQGFAEEVNADPVNGGYFLPSQDVGKFFESMQRKYNISRNWGNTIGTGSEPSFQIFWKLFELVVEMIGTLQKAAAVLSQRLLFLSTYQKAYTEMINAIPIFTTPTPFSSENDVSELNQKNDILRENLRSLRGLLSDDSKALQTNTSQLNDAVDQESNLAAGLLQQYSSIISTIFK